MLSNNQLPRLKDRIKTVTELDAAIGNLIAQYYYAKNVEQKYELAKQMVLNLTGATGFFEWSSIPKS
jgi:hypothetical protein